MPRGFFEDPDFSKVFPTLKDEVLKITDNDKKFEISVDTHGYKPEELQVKVLDDVVTVEAKHEEKKSEENNKSFVSRQFSRYILCTTLYQSTLVKTSRICTGQYTFQILLLNDDNMLGEH